MEQAFRNGDLPAVAGFYADDALMIGPGTRAEGAEAILAYWQQISDPINWTLEVQETTGTGEVVHQTGRSHLTYLDGLEERTSIVDFFLVWRRHEDGSYKIAVDSYHDPRD
jgi:uncharacterized protein (TIGR02246 family)